MSAAEPMVEAVMPAEPERYNISPEMFERLMRGEPIDPTEILKQAAAYAPTAAGLGVEGAVAPTTEALGTEPTKKKKEKKSKKAKVSKKKKGCC